ncbi:MAG: hypothetical protein WC808_01575 [Patescibacteria group bacterium]
MNRRTWRLYRQMKEAGLPRPTFPEVPGYDDNEWWRFWNHCICRD